MINTRPVLIASCGLVAAAVMAAWLAGRSGTQAAPLAATSPDRAPLPAGVAHPVKAEPAPAPATPSPLAAESARVDNPILARFLDRTVSERVTPDIAIRIPAVTLPDEVAAVLAVLRDVSDNDTVRHEAINLLRRSSYAGLTQELIARLDQAGEQERFRSFIAQHLGESLSKSISAQERDLLGARLRRALQDPHLAVRREALAALVRAEDPVAIATVRAGLDDPAWASARDLIIHCVGDLAMNDLMPAVRPFAYDGDPVVRIAALHVLGRWRDEASKPAFQEAAASNVVRLQRAGNLALSLLADAPARFQARDPLSGR